MRQHRLALALALLAGGATSVAAQVTPAPTAAPRAQAALRALPSTRATTEVTLAPVTDSTTADAPTVSIRLDYGQPHLRGRTLHTDSLVPYDRPWRTGANALTTLTTGVDLTVGGTALPKGTYKLYTLPGREGWKLIIQRDAGQTAEQGYDAAHDLARIDLRRQTLATPVESLTMWLIPAVGPGPARGELRLAWGTSALSTDWSVR